MTTKANSQKYEARSLPPEIADAPATMQELAALADAMLPALQSARADIDEIRDGFADMLDEIERGFAKAAAPLPEQQRQVVDVNIVAPDRGEKPKASSSDSDQVARAISFYEAQRARKRFARSIFDDKGRLIGVERVDTLDDVYTGGRR